MIPQRFWNFLKWTWRHKLHHNIPNLKPEFSEVIELHDYSLNFFHERYFSKRKQNWKIHMQSEKSINSFEMKKG